MHTKGSRGMKNDFNEYGIEIDDYVLVDYIVNI